MPDLNSIGLEQISNGVYMFQAKAPEKPLLATFKRDSGKKILKFGDRNNFPQELIRNINNSPTARACTKAHAKFLAGDGFTFSESAFKDAAETIFSQGLLQKVAYDYTYFEAVTLRLYFNLNGNIKRIEHVDCSTVRLGEIDETTGMIEYARISPNWEDVNKKENEPISIDLYDDVKVKEKIQDFNARNAHDEFSKWNGALVYAKRYAPGQPFYAVPSWAASLSWIYTDGEIQKFHANNIDNAFMPSVILYVPGELSGTVTDSAGNTMTKKEAFEKHIDDNLTGADNGGTVTKIYGKDKDAAPQITQFNANSNHELFIALSDLITKHITRAFQIPQILAGIETPGSLGSTNEIMNSIELYYNTVIKDDANFILDIFRPLSKRVDGYSEIEIGIANSKPFNYVDPALLQYFDESEIRVGQGYDAVRPSAIKPAEAVTNA